MYVHTSLLLGTASLTSLIQQALQEILHEGWNVLFLLKLLRRCMCWCGVCGHFGCCSLWCCERIALYRERALTDMTTIEKPVSNSTEPTTNHILRNGHRTE